MSFKIIPDLVIGIFIPGTDFSKISEKSKDKNTEKNHWK